MPDAPAGVIYGGWAYAIAAYTITAVVLAIYSWSLITRLRKANREDSQP